MPPVPAAPTKIFKLFGLGHSGSTMLGLHLASHPQVLGVGELGHFASRPVPERCFCGAASGACPFWGPLLATTPAPQLADIVTRAEAFAPGHALVDATKAPGWDAQYLAPAMRDRIELTPIFLVRDYRGWVLSRQRLYARKGEPAQGYVRLATSWMLNNVRTLRRIEASFARAPVIVSYERFVADPRTHLARVWSAAGLAPAQGAAPNLHALWGNRLLDGQDWRALRYDASWISDWRSGVAPLLAPVHAFNQLLHARAA
jgi:hypothetical protein